MSTDWIAQARARCEQATPGPWSRHDFGYPGQEEPSSIVVHAGRFDWRSIEEGGFVAMTPAWDAQENDNAEFIAAARTDLPRALAALERVRALCDQAEATVLVFHGQRMVSRVTTTAIRAALDADHEAQQREGSPA